MQNIISLNTPDHLTVPEVSGRSVWQKKLFRLILFFSLYKCFFAFTLELGNDEAYYWVFSQYLEWNYFDHPPMVGVWIRVFSFNLLFQDFEGFVRLGSIVGSAISSWFIFKTVAVMHSERAGWFAACMYHASFYAGITAGLYILPDTPQMVFWTFSLLMLARITKNENNWLNWILFGLGVGLCIMSKVHGVFLWFGLGLYILCKRWSWLVKPQLYVSFLLTALIISPIIFWNIKYDFITYRFHSERVVIDSFSLKTNSFLKELLNQLSLNNSFNVGLAIAGLIVWKKKQLKKFTALQIYNFIGLPLALLLLFISLFRNTVLPHWSGPAYVTLIPLAAVYLAEINLRLFPKILRWAMLIFILGLAGMWVLIRYLPGTYGHQDNNNLGRLDLTLDMYGWTEAGNQFEKFYKTDVEKGIMPEGAPLVSTTWGGAHAEYYFGRPAGLQLICFGNPVSIHQYLWINKIRMKHIIPDSVYCISSSTKTFSAPTNYYREKELAAVFVIKRGGKDAHRFYIFRLRGLKKPIPVVDDVFAK